MITGLICVEVDNERSALVWIRSEPTRLDHSPEHQPITFSSPIHLKNKLLLIPHNNEGSKLKYHKLETKMILRKTKKDPS